MKKISLMLICGVVLFGLCGCGNKETNNLKEEQNNNNQLNDKQEENINYEIVDVSFKKEYKAKDNEIYGYIHQKIINDYCKPLVPPNELIHEYCDALDTDTKYSELNIQETQLTFINKTKEELLDIETKLYNETISSGKNIFIDIYTFKSNGILTKKFISQMEYWVLSSETIGTYSKINDNTYYYNIEDCDDNGVIYINQGYFCKNNNTCIESEKYKKQ